MPTCPERKRLTISVSCYRIQSAQHERDILQVATETEVIFSANTPRAHTWIQYCFGSSTVTFRLPNEKEKAEEFHRLTKVEKLQISDV
jgi:hypothetical protein